MYFINVYIVINVLLYIKIMIFKNDSNGQVCNSH